MKTKIVASLGSAVGTVIYQTFREGFQQVDWYRVATVGIITFVLLLFIPARFFERKKNPAN